MAVGELLGPSTFVCVMTGKWFIYYGSWHIKAELLMKLHPLFMLCSLEPWHPKERTATLSILNDWLLHLCYTLWDIMQMCNPLASRPHCSLPIIRHDYALLPAKAASANKFTMTIIIFRPSGTGSGHGADRCSISKDVHVRVASSLVVVCKG